MQVFPDAELSPEESAIWEQRKRGLVWGLVLAFLLPIAMILIPDRVLPDSDLGLIFNPLLIPVAVLPVAIFVRFQQRCPRCNSFLAHVHVLGQWRSQRICLQCRHQLSSPI